MNKSIVSEAIFADLISELAFLPWIFLSARRFSKNPSNRGQRLFLSRHHTTKCHSLHSRNMTTWQKLRCGIVCIFLAYCNDPTFQQNTIPRLFPTDYTILTNENHHHSFSGKIHKRREGRRSGRWSTEPQPRQFCWQLWWRGTSGRPVCCSETWAV